MREFRAPSWFAVLVAASLASTPLARATEAPARLGFADAIRLAAGGSPNVQLASLKERETRAREGQVRSVLLPQLSASASMNDRTFNLLALGISFPTIPGQPGLEPLQGPVQAVDARLRISQTLLDVSAWQKLRAARLGSQVARSDRAGSDEGAAQQAGLAYLRAARASAALDARTEDLRLAKELQALAELQSQAGTAPGIDVTRARTQVAASQGAVLVARNLRDRTQLELTRVIGVDPASRFELADTLSAALGSSDAPEDDAAVPFALEHRVDLRGEQARLARARVERSATSMERLPRVDVAADWGASGAHPSDAIATRQVAIAASVPLFDGFRRESRLNEQGAIVEQAVVRERDLNDAIATDVRSALLDLSSGREQLAVAAERLALAEKELAQARDRFENGVAGNIEIINAQASLVRARDADIEARYAVASARVALARAAGAARTLR